MKTILVVDDKEENLYYLQALLEGNGYGVVTACHGAEALAKARTDRPAVVISDLLMPVMDGYTLLRHWKHDSSLRQIPFIVYTATYTEPEDKRLALSLGADAFILKPCEPEEFIDRLRDVQHVSASGKIAEPELSAGSGDVLLRQYSEALIRKLEEKMLELEEANRELEKDIARRKAAEKQVEQLAFYDPLTGLPNRRLMQDRLAHSVASSSRLKMYGALLFLDIDNFKSLNDTKGHSMGDQLLIQVADRLKASVREGDTVARIGGDEFVVILEALSADEEQAASMAEDTGELILNSLAKPYPLAGANHHASASVGVSLFMGSKESVDELLRRADAALYQAKQSSRNILHFYDSDMQLALQTRMQLENDLRRALEENEFRLYYQPQVDEKGKVVGAEALIRWQSPEKGLVAPGHFIQLAEETGLIVPIGNWVMETACRQLKTWENSPEWSSLQLAINVSVHQFHLPQFIEQVLAIVSETGVNPHLLKFELTESVILDDVDAAREKIRQLRKVGICFAMDDFGTGYSSLAYLTRLPLDQLKIDRSFVHDIGRQPENEIIVQTIIGMADNLNLEVVAEGVETPEQFEFLKKHGCPIFQGYLFGRPVSIDEFSA